MNFRLKLEDTNWQNFAQRALQILSSSDGLLKRALLVVWPAEVASHFEQEEGWNGPWAPWKQSTRAARVSHEIRALIGKAHAEGRLTAKQRAKGIAKRAQVHSSMRLAGQSVRRGGKLLQKSGRMRTETVQDPILSMVAKGLQVESRTPYSGYLDEGTENEDGSTRIIARPFMWLGDDAQERMAQIFVNALGDDVGGSA